MSCDYPAEWPPEVHQWHRGDEPISPTVVSRFGLLLGKHRDDQQVQHAARYAAQEYVQAAQGEDTRLQRLQWLVGVYGIDPAPGLTQAQSAEAYLRT